MSDYYTPESEGLGAELIQFTGEGERIWLEDLNAQELIEVVTEQGRILATATPDNTPAGARAAAFGFDTRVGKPFMVLVDFAQVAE